MGKITGRVSTPTKPLNGSVNSDKYVIDELKRLDIRVDRVEEEQEVMRLDISNLFNEVSEVKGDLLIISSQLENQGERISTLETQIEERVPKRLNLIDEVEATDSRDNMYLYVDNNGQDGKISLKQAVGTILRLDDRIPEDMQSGEFIFLEQNLRGLRNK